MYAKQRQVASNAWNGGSWNNLRARAHTRTHTYIYALGERVELKRMREEGEGCRLCTVADSLGPEDISQRGWGPGRILRVASFLSSPPPWRGKSLLSFARATACSTPGTSLWNYEREILSLFRAVIPGSRRSLRLKGGSLLWPLYVFNDRICRSPFEKRPSAARDPMFALVPVPRRR